MKNDELYARLTDVFREVLEDDTINLNPELTADQTKGWDSLKHVRLLLNVEQAFDIKIPTAEMVRLKNVGDLAGLIARKTALTTSNEA